MNQSKKGFTLVEIMIVVVIIGLLAAMAIPAFQKVRQNSQEKTILNNLRQIASGGQQYIMEVGTTDADFSSILADGYLGNVEPVAGEVYTGLTVEGDLGTLQVSYSNGQVIYSY
jgi:type IV pilus assembly protein PilA